MPSTLPAAALLLRLQQHAVLREVDRRADVRLGRLASAVGVEDVHAHGEALVLAQRHAEQAADEQAERARRRRQLDDVGEADVVRGGAIAGGRAGGGDHDERDVREPLVGADGGDGGGGVTVGQDAIDEAEIGAGAQLLEQVVGVARGHQAQVAAAQQVAVEVARQVRVVRGDDRLHQATISHHSGSSESG